MATNKEVCEETLMKTYNNIDCKDQLIYVEVVKDKFAGYKRELLVNPLSELEIDFYVCTECKGVMRNACTCQRGEEQNLVCEGCVKEGVPPQPLMKSRKKILELQAKCSLDLRDCNWNGTLAEIEEHLIVCEKVIVKCENACDVILPRSELDSHLMCYCVKRQVKCEHCTESFDCEKLQNHYQECLEYQVPCPKNCDVNLKRKLIDSHLELECPNMVVECPYKKFGCEQELLRCELEEHKKTNQIQHFESTSLFAIREMEELKQTNTQLTETNRQLTETNIQLTGTNRQLTERLNTLENRIEKLSYPTILRNELVNQFTRYSSPQSFEVDWKFLKIHLVFQFSNSAKTSFVSAALNYDDTKTPFTNWLFEGRFKLSIIDNINRKNSLIYESKIVKLQPQNLPKDKGQYPSSLSLGNISTSQLLQYRFCTGNKITFTLQIQETENQ